MTIEDDDDLAGLARAGRAVAEARDAMLATALPGTSTAELDARREGFRVIGNLSGHGVGRGIHEPPSMPSTEAGCPRLTLWEGLVLAIEPFLSPSPDRAVEDPDGWTLRTHDGSRGAQFEHTVVVTRGAPLILTAS